MPYSLIQVSDPQDWESYHAIRKVALFDARGLEKYNPDHPDEHLPDHYPLLLKCNGKPMATTRLDDRKDGTGIVRLVAVTASEQGKGHGRVLDKMVEDLARTLGIHCLYLNANPEAVGYYRRLGWKFYSWDPLELTGIAANCTQMKKTLVG